MCIRDRPKSYPSIDTVINRQWTDRELKKKSSNANRVISGSPYQVATQLKQLKKDYHVDEIMILPHVYGEANRKRLLELVMEYSKTWEIIKIKVQYPIEYIIEPFYL